ncbi:SET domain containing 2 isoform X2 [Arctopsyche grandis]|uniref:SET domain containing 2 isoform X2 n=1 Tax=Arctopsyche grandis TaxID=121162 RepID=UPI00406DA4D8
MGRKKKATATTRGKATTRNKASTVEPRAPPKVITKSDPAFMNKDCSESESQDSNSLTMPMASMSHKNFGKYRCLAEKVSQMSEMCGDICGTPPPNVEVKIVDPCASSESDNSNSIEILNSMNHTGGSDMPVLRSLGRINRSDRSSDSGSPISFKLLRTKLLQKINCENKINNENDITLSTVSFDTQLPDPTLNIITCNDPRRGFTSSVSHYSDILESFSPIMKADVDSNDAVDGFADSYENEKLTEDDSKDYVEKMSNNDDEMYTIFEILDDNPEGECGDSKMEHNLFSVSDSVMSDNSVNNTLVNTDASSSFSRTKDDRKDTLSPVKDVSTDLDDFENRISSIKLSSNIETYSMSENVCSDFPSKSLTVLEERKIDDSTNASETCSTPTSMVSEEDSRTASKLEPERVEPLSNCSTDSSSSSSISGIRRSNRIKTINVLKQRSRGHGLVKTPPKSSLAKDVITKNLENEKLDKSNLSTLTSQCSPVFSVPNMDAENRPVKVKSRWRRSSEMEMGSRSPITPPLNSPNTLNASSSKLSSENSNDANGRMSVETVDCSESKTSKKSDDQAIQDRLSQFLIILENEYHCDRAISKEARKMTCDCFLTKEEVERGELGCGEDCLNRLLMIECNSRCPVGGRCTNRRFQTNQYSELRVIKTERKGLGIQAVDDIPRGEFLMEYVGEVLNWEQFNQRAQEYSSDKNTHHYFMSLKGDAVIDATLKGNISRFINHSCDPNAETQKWTVNGDLRIGFFSKKDITAGDEITFDYQFQRYGKEGLRCFCEASNCRGWIGEEPDSSEDEDEPEEPEVDSEVVIEAKTLVEDENLDVLVEESNEVSDPTPDVVDNMVVEDQTKIVTVTRRRSKRNRFASCKNDLRQDMDLEEEMNMLHLSGIKNQSHTLALCRAMVRAKQIEARILLLRLLATADLPCRRLFLDYRGLRLLASWCEDADDFVRLEILFALKKLPIPNKTLLEENKILSTIEKWQEDTKDDSSDDSRPGTPVFIDESTGLPAENVSRFKSTDSSQDSQDSIKKDDENINKLSKQLLENWASLQEVFKIPKKERIQLMKEHERQANELQAENDKEKETPKEERWEERYNRHDREKKRPVISVLDLPRRNQIRLDDRVLASVPPMSKEERRREFAARAAHQEQLRRAQASLSNTTVLVDPNASRGPILTPTGHWTPNHEPIQSIPPANYGNIIVNGAPGTTPVDYGMTDFTQPEYMQIDYPSNEYAQPNKYQFGYSANQQIYPTPPVNSSMPPPVPGYSFNPNYNTVPYQSTNYCNTPPVPPVSPFQNMSIPPGHSQSNLSTCVMPIHTISSIPSQLNISPLASQPIPSIVAMQTNSVIQNPSPTIAPQPIPTLVPSLPSQYLYSANNAQHSNTVKYYQPPPDTKLPPIQDHRKVETTTLAEDDNINDVGNDVIPWTPVRLPSRWRSMKDPRGRTYYYHVKYRIPQWEPPLYSPTLNSDDGDSSLDEKEASDDETKDNNEVLTDGTYDKLIEGVNGIYKNLKEDKVFKKNGMVKKVQYFTHKVKKSRPRLVTERIISPRLEEDKINAKMDLKRYKETKEKLRKRKELALAAAGCPDSLNKYKKRSKSSKHKKVKEPPAVVEVGEKAARHIKEKFRASMARVMVHHLDPYRRDDCIIGHITNTADFKHLARKLTHFVMLKELKHCQTVSDLECNDSVKQKAKEFVKKYMAKYGPVYIRPLDEVDC